MVKKIYGVDLNKPVTPIMVRDAIIECFVKAHGKMLESFKDGVSFNSNKDFKDAKGLYVRMLIKTMFDDMKADYYNPTKKDLIQVVKYLKAYSTNFRKSSVIEKHAMEIMKLINNIPE